MFFWYKKVAKNVSEEFVDLLSKPEQLLQQSEILKDDKSTTVGKFAWQKKQYIIKRFNARNKGHAVKRSMRRSRASNCWHISQTFINCGLSVAKPIAMLEHRILFFKAKSFFISEYVDGAEILDWLPEQDTAMRAKVKQKVIEIFAIFNANRLSHGDMKATNLLWSGEQIVLIDLDVAKQHSTRILFARAHMRDKRRFIRNGALFAKIINSYG